MVVRHPQVQIKQAVQVVLVVVVLLIMVMELPDQHQDQLHSQELLVQHHHQVGGVLLAVLVEAPSAGVAVEVLEDLALQDQVHQILEVLVVLAFNFPQHLEILPLV